MKKYMSIILITVMLVSILCSCGNENTTKLESGNQTATDQLSTSSPGTSDANPNETQAPPAMGGSNEDICQVHDITYHSYPNTLIDYVGREKFMEWVKGVEIPVRNGSCLYPDGNIYTFIHEFNIPRNYLEEKYWNSGEYYGHIWNLDLLYSDDEEAVDRFYRNTEELHSISEKRHNLWEIKWAIQDDYYDKWMEEYGTEELLPTISVNELVEKFDISREKLEEYAKTTRTEGTDAYDFNFDAIYGSEGGIQKAPSKGGTTEVKPYEEDMAFCGIDNIYID